MQISYMYFYAQYMITTTFIFNVAHLSSGSDC